MQIAQTKSFLDLLRKERGYDYLQTCLKEMSCIDWLDFCAKMYRRNKKATTALICCRAMCYLNEDYKTANAGKALCDDLRLIINKQDTKKALELPDDFVNYCEVDNQLLAGATSVHVRAIKRVQKYAGVKIDSDDFADKVFMSKTTAANEELPKDEEIRQIPNYATPRMRAAIMLMCNSGLGRSETIRL